MALDIGGMLSSPIVIRATQEHFSHSVILTELAAPIAQRERIHPVALQVAPIVQPEHIHHPVVLQAV